AERAQKVDLHGLASLFDSRRDHPSHGDITRIGDQNVKSSKGFYRRVDHLLRVLHSVNGSRSRNYPEAIALECRGRVRQGPLSASADRYPGAVLCEFVCDGSASTFAGPCHWGNFSLQSELPLFSSPLWRGSLLRITALLLSRLGTGNQVQCKVPNGLLKEPIFDFILGPV